MVKNKHFDLRRRITDLYDGKIKKERINFTIDKGVLKMFDEYCDKNLVSRSEIIEDAIKKFLDRRKNEIGE